MKKLISIVMMVAMLITLVAVTVNVSAEAEQPSHAVTTAEEFNQILTNIKENEIIRLEADIVLNQTISVFNTSFIINLNGFTLDIEAPETGGAINIANQNVLTVRGPGVLNATTTELDWYAIGAASGGKLELTNEAIINAESLTPHRGISAIDESEITVTSTTGMLVNNSRVIVNPDKIRCSIGNENLCVTGNIIARNGSFVEVNSSVSGSILGEQGRNQINITEDVVGEFYNSVISAINDTHVLIGRHISIGMTSQTNPILFANETSSIRVRGLLMAAYFEYIKINEVSFGPDDYISEADGSFIFANGNASIIIATPETGIGPPPTPPTQPPTEPPIIGGSPPRIFGPSELSIGIGYSSFEMNFTVSGDPAPEVTISNTLNDRVSWDSENSRLLVSSGLGQGTYQIVINAENHRGSASHIFTFTVSNVPQTGDDITNTYLFIILGFSITGMLASAIFIKRKQKKIQESL
jgi:LPXTG-motif cell wall-anchored protein